MEAVLQNVGGLFPDYNVFMEAVLQNVGGLFLMQVIDK
jgi:hypothetical protein